MSRRYYHCNPPDPACSICQDYLRERGVTVVIERPARCPACGSTEVVDTGYTHGGERTLACDECGQHFEEGDG